MKLSVDCCIISEKFGDKEAVKMIKEAGFDCFDYSFCCRGNDLPIFGENHREYACDLRKYIDEIGIFCNQAHAPFPLGYGIEFCESNPKYLRLIRSMESASILGAKNIVVHAQHVPEETGEDTFEYNVRYYKSLIPYCEKFGISVAVENLARIDPRRKCYIESFAGTPEAQNKFLDEVNSPWIVACLDTGHASLVSVDPEKFILKSNKNRLKALHVHDTDFVEDRHTVPFICDLNWEAIMKNLKKIGYEGDLTFEIPEYFARIPNPLIPDALIFAQKVGRHLIGIFENN